MAAMWKYVGMALALVASAHAIENERAGADLATVDVDSVISHAPSIDTLSSFPFVQLLDKNDIQVNSDFTFTSAVHSVVIITNAEGINETGAVTIGYIEEYDSVTVDVARSIGPDGTVYPVPAEQILDDIAPSELMDNDLYTDQRQMRINFQGLRIGSIVECKYTIRRYREYFPGFSSSFWFSLRAPSRLAIVSVRCPEHMPLLAKVYRANIEPSVVLDDGFVTRTWRMDNIHELPREPGQPNWPDLATRLELTSFSDWAQYAKVFHDSMWATDLAAPLSECEQSVLTSLGLDGLSPIGKLKRIYYWLQDHTRYLGFEMGVNNLQPHQSAVICRKLYGDCKDLTNLLVKLLRHEGIGAWPAVLATGRVLNDESFAAYFSTDHVVAFVPDVDGKEFWLDPTLDHALLGSLSPAVHNTMAVILGYNKDVVRHIPTTPSNIDRQKVVRRAVIDATGGGRTETTNEFSGIYAISIKSYLAQLNKDQLSNFFQSQVPPSAHDLQYEVRGLEDCDSTLTIVLSYADDNVAQIAGNLLIIKGKENDIDFDNSEAMERRTTDVYIGFTPSFDIETEITYPPEYKVQYVPKDVNLECDFFTFARHVETGDSGRVRVTKTAEVRSPSVPLATYEKYRSALQEMYVAQQESIVFETVSKE